MSTETEALTTAANRLADTFSAADSDWWSEAEYIAQLYQPAVGRPSIVTDVPRIAKYLSKIAAGNYLETAAKLAGITKQVIYEWRVHADNPKHENRATYQAFVNAEKRAEAAGEDEQVQNTRNAAKDPRFWAAGMTLLERRFPDRWARRNEDSSAPKVLVQIGVRDSDVQVSIASHPVSPSLPDAPVSLSLLNPMQSEAVSD